MKFIIIIQSLIIIAGAYYVYLLSNNSVEETTIETIPQELMPVGVPGEPREGYTPPTGNPPADPALLDSEVTGHSDVGMEFPIPDEDVQVR
jgi:hypothetical protein